METQAPPAATADTLEQVARELRAEWGVDARRIRLLACALADGRWHETGELVRDHALSRRTVEGLVTRLRPWLDERGDGVRVASAHRAAMAAAWGCPVAPPAPPPAIEGTMAELMRGLPRSDRNLDHVPATPATAARRARFLAETFDLPGAGVLCLGDHDLTSLALALVCPEARIDVVDVDERILEHVDRAAADRGWPVRALFADLRVGLPPSVREAEDLVFTDPPYAPAGMHLFLARALAALRPRDVSRVVYCHGYGERHPALGLKAQEVAHRLHLVAETILPGFNRYDGAEAVGGASSLHVCRPTRRSWSAAARPHPGDPRIYSRGESAEEARLETVPAAVVERVRRLAAEAGEAPVLVGDGWPEGEAGRLSLARYLDDVRSPRGKPPFTGAPHAGVVAVNLSPHLGGYLPRLLLGAAARRLVAVAPHDAAGALVGGRLARLVGVRWGLTTVDAALPIVVADRLAEPPADRSDRALRALLDRAAATLGSAWREALVATAAAEGGAVTKNQARAAIASTPTGSRYAGCHVTELPLHRLRDLPAEVARSLDALG
jgi:hypothetical protein